jgi:signal transduction histidine kinase
LQERALILREMHDGVGNFLTLALRAAASSVPDMVFLNELLKNCMLDLRLMIDSLGESDSGADTVATVLGNLRYRMDPALKAEGIEFTWKVEDVKILAPLSPRNVLNLTRIFQEALTNVIKHAQASTVVMQSETILRSERRWAVITLSDNGRWNRPSESTSYGLENMQSRADQLHGFLRVMRTPVGSIVELSLPEERRSTPRF